MMKRRTNTTWVAEIGSCAAVLFVCVPATLGAADAKPQPHVVINGIDARRTQGINVAFQVRNDGAAPVYVLDPTQASARVQDKRCLVAIDDDLRKAKLAPGHFSPVFVTLKPGESRGFDWKSATVFSRCKSVTVSVALAVFQEDPAAAVKSGDEEGMITYVLEHQFVIAAKPQVVRLRGERD